MSETLFYSAVFPLIDIIKVTDEFTQLQVIKEDFFFLIPLRTIAELWGVVSLIFKIKSLIYFLFRMRAMYLQGTYWWDVKFIKIYYKKYAFQVVGEFIIAIGIP